MFVYLFCVIQCFTACVPLVYEGPFAEDAAIFFSYFIYIKMGPLEHSNVLFVLAAAATMRGTHMQSCVNSYKQVYYLLYP